jgi:hypothetical protein
VHPARPHSQELKLSGVATRRGKGEKAVDIAQGGRQGINLYMYLSSLALCMGWYFLYFMTSHHFYLFLLISQNKRQERAAGALETAAPFGDSFFLFTPSFKNP